MRTRTRPGALAREGTKFTLGTGAVASGEPSEARCARARRQYSADRSENRSSPCPARYFISARQRSPFASFQAIIDEELKKAKDSGVSKKDYYAKQVVEKGEKSAAM